METNCHDCFGSNANMTHDHLLWCCIVQFKAAHTILRWMASTVSWPPCKEVTVQVISDPFLWLSLYLKHAWVMYWFSQWVLYVLAEAHLSTKILYTIQIHKHTWMHIKATQKISKVQEEAQLFPGHFSRRWKIEEFLLIWTKISIKHSVRDWVICALMQPTEYLQWCSARISCVRGLVKLHYCCFI